MKKLLIFLIVPQFLFAQSWIDRMQDPTENFYEVQEEFNSYWENKTIEKGKGWKQFKRWENFVEQRVFPDGIQHPELLMEEYNNLQEANNQFNMLPPNVWTQVGPSNVPLQSDGSKRGIGRVNTIAFHPTDANTIYVGAPAGGFWKSVNGGQTWQTSTDFLTNLGVSDIAIHPLNPDTIYIITGDRDGGDTYSYGFLKSYDGGTTWQTTGLSFNITQYYKGNRVLIDPNNPNILIVSTSNGIYRSIDGGNTFANTFSVSITSMEFHPTNSNIIYGGSNGSTSIYKSSDNGISWSQAGTGLPPQSDVVRACVGVTLDNPSVVYALFGGNNNGFYGVYKSTNEGLTWTQQANSPNLLGWSTTGSDSDGQAWYDLAFEISPQDENTLFVGGVNCWKSTNGGQSWNINTHWYGGGGATYMHADEHMLKYNPLNNYIYSGNDGGLYYSTDNGNNWTDISDGLQITQFYSLGVSQTVQDKVITGAQDNGTFLKTTNNWDAVIGGDGMECIIDYTNANIMYGALYYGDIRKSTNGGNSFSSIGPSNNGAWETPYELDRNDPNTIYIGYDELYKTTDGGNNWSIITNNETNGGKIDEIGVSKSNSNVIYFSDGPNIFATTNGGNSWSNISNNLPYKTISYIIVHPTDANKVWLTFSGYTSSEKVYKTIDGGNSWVNISGTLPNIPVNCIVLDESSNNENLYIGTDLGVFTTDSTITDWNVFNNNSLPNVIVSELEIQYQSNKLIAATYGRGLWNIDLQITSPPIANFSYSDSMFCNVPADVSFYNNSYYANTYVWDFGDGNSSTATNPNHTYTSYGTFTVTLTASGSLGIDSIIQQSIISIDPNNPCITTLPPSGVGVVQTACSGTLYDAGGPIGNYYDNNNSWITIAPQGSSQITLSFTSFDIEAPSSSINCNYDYVEIFDGADTTANSLGQYCNTLTGSPGVLTSSGGAITIYLHADQAVNGTGFEASWSCLFPTTTPVVNFSLSDTISCSTSINFSDLSSNGPTAWLWDFGDGNTSTLQNPTHNYLNSGDYTIKLVASNQYGTDSLILTNHLTIIDVNLQTIGSESCGASSLTLNALSTNGTVNWYSDTSATNLLYTGNSFTTPVLSASTSYYAQLTYNFPILNGGPVDNNFGAGSYFQGDRFLIFDNYKASTLKSVLVYAGSDGYRTIELRNSSNAVISDTTVYIPFSPNGFRVNLNFVLPIQNNMQLGVSAPNSDLYRTSSGAVFPYNISNIIAITGTDASAGYYYFFYDWEVQADPCVSAISNVDAIINNDFTNTDNIGICISDSVLIGNNYYSVSGTYIDTFTTSFGCDSIIITQLSVGQNATFSQQINICGGGTFQVGNNVYNSTGTYIDTIIFGSCDSVITTNLMVYESYQDTIKYSICNGDNLFVNNTNYSQTGFYTTTFTTSQGCDSIVVLDIEVVGGGNYTVQATICQGDSYIIGNNVYYYPGIYSEILTTADNCDSIITTHLSVTPYVYSTQQVFLCEGDSFLVDDNLYTTSGIYDDTLQLINSCDSIVTSHLSFSDVNIQIYSQNGSLYANVINGMMPYSYLWNTGETTAFITPSTSGSFWLLVTDAYNCISDTAYFIIDDVSVIDDSEILSDISIYPNPSDGLVTISFESAINDDFIVTIYNVLTEVIFEEELIQFSGIYEKQINLKNYAKSVYLVKIKSSFTEMNKKLILR